MANDSNIEWTNDTLNLWLILIIFVFLNTFTMSQTKEGAIKVAAKKTGLSLDEYKEKSEKEKWCSLGKHWASKNAFSTDNSRYDKLNSSCKKCRSVKNPYASLKGRESTFKGKKHTEEAKAKISTKAKGRPSPMKGRTHTKGTKDKISKALRKSTKKGEESHSYKDGKLSERRGIRFSKEYKNWRYDVFSRDSFTCQKCGDSSGGNLNAHHVKSFADFPDLRFNIDNGITLCVTCHKNEHYG